MTKSKPRKAARYAEAKRLLGAFPLSKRVYYNTYSKSRSLKVYLYRFGCTPAQLRTIAKLERQLTALSDYRRFGSHAGTIFGFTK